jgi:N-acyl-D-aspartate/D-glutamate deacylase
MSLQNPYQWSRVPAFTEVLGKDAEVMAKYYADPAWRARARAETEQVAAQTDFLDGDIVGYFDRTSVEETTRHTALRGIPLSRLAAERGVHPFDLMLDLALEEGLSTRFRNTPVSTKDELTALVQDHRAVLGAHDAAAHVDMLCDSCYPSFTLRYWVREEGALGLEEAVWRMTGQPAEVFGIPDRGVIRPGLVADLVAFDPDTVGELPFERLHDFPAGGERLVSRSQGIEHVWVAGVPTLQAGNPIPAAYPGQVIS